MEPVFTEEDSKRAGQFAQFLLKAHLDLKVADWIEFNKLLIWYNSVVKKIDDHVLEIKSVKAALPTKAKGEKNAR